MIGNSTDRVINSGQIVGRPIDVTEEKWNAIFGRSSAPGAGKETVAEVDIPLAPVEAPALPETSLEVPAPVVVAHPLAEMEINVSFVDRAGLWVHQQIENTKLNLALIDLAVRIILTVQSMKEHSMIGVLKLTGRICKIVGGIVGAGGILASLLDPKTGAMIFAGAIVLGDIIVSVGDWADDGKINKSFKIDE